MSERRAVYAIFDGLIHATRWAHDSPNGRSHEFTVGRTDGEDDHFRNATTFHEQEMEALVRVVERAVSVIRNWAARGESDTSNPVRADCTEWAASRYRGLIQVRGWEVYNTANTDLPHTGWGTFIDMRANKNIKKRT